MVRRMYHAKVQEAIRLIRPLWTVTLDGAVYGDYDWQPLTENEAEELHVDKPSTTLSATKRK